MTNQQINLSERITPVETLNFENLDKNYKYAQMIGAVLVYMLLMAAAVILLLVDETIAFIVAECVIAVFAIINIAILPKAFHYKGYAFREHDVSFKSGIIFPKIITIPFSRVQQVSINRNPIARLFGLCTVEIVNGAQALSSLHIPGLTEVKASQIKNIVTENMKNCHD